MPVTELVCEGTTYHVIGTAHVSLRSVEEVRAAIAAIQPEVVCVELDRRRYEALTRGSAFRDLDVMKAVRDGRALYLIAQIILGAYQRRIGARLGVKPGAEMLAAIEAANAAGIPIELIDRDIDITFHRTWHNLGLGTRAALIVSLLVALRSVNGRGGAPITAEEIEGLKQPRALSDMLTELGRAVPELKAPLIDERDQYLVSRMAEVGRGRRSVVAVVGAAHVPGMQANLGTPIDRSALEQIPPRSRLWRTLRSLVPIAFTAGLVYGWRGGAPLSDLMLAWIVPTSIGAGSGALVAGGSIASVLSAIAVAPIGALVPRLNTGRLVGMIEAQQRRPSLLDRERLPADSETLRGFRRNPVTRVLLVAIAAGIGATAGFWIGALRVALRL